MGRQSLRIVMVLGVLVTLVGGTGIFAAFTDRATAGANEVTSGTRPSAADLKIESGANVSDSIACDPIGNFVVDSDNTDVAQFTMFSMGVGDAQLAYLCLRNGGSAPLDITITAADLADLDVDCTGDEAAAGDTTCGLDESDAPQAGELSALLTVDADPIDCNVGGLTRQNNPAVALSDLTSAVFLGGPDGSPLAPDDTVCARILLTYDSSASESDAQIAQSDKVTWRFAFDGTAR